MTDTDAMLTDAIAVVEQALMSHGYSAQHVIVIAEVTSPDLDIQHLIAVSNGLQQWQAMGLLEYAKTLEIQNVLDDTGDDE